MGRWTNKGQASGGIDPFKTWFCEDQDEEVGEQRDRGQTERGMDRGWAEQGMKRWDGKIEGEGRLKRE